MAFSAVPPEDVRVLVGLMPLYVMSDLHLCDEWPGAGSETLSSSFMFNREKQGIFLSIIDEILEQEGELLLAGDIFDLTGMSPPRHGLSDFFSEILGEESLSDPDLIWAAQDRGVDLKIQAIQKRFPEFFIALGKLAEKEKLSFVPGNHDFEVSSNAGIKALAEAMKVDGSKIVFLDSVFYQDFLIAAHGHEFDLPNQTLEIQKMRKLPPDAQAQSGLNPGAAITSALYRGLIPVLNKLGMSDEIVAAIPAVRPEEAIVEGILEYLGPEKGKKLILAFVRLLERAGYFKGFKSSPLWLLVHRVPYLTLIVEKYVTAERLKKAMPTDECLKAMAREGARRLKLRFGSKVQVVVLGHTHELDWDDHYLNLGTWIDHISGLKPEDIVVAEKTLPLLRIGSESSRLTDARTGRILWERPRALSRL